ncbi:MAG: glycosyltransferase family 2 protein [Bacteroidales bacterium]|nr:glycosyltransferase family 2 protein [Bacteroidales bacterium]
MMQNTANISAVILVKNAEKTIAECLESLCAFGEVVLLDNGSTDATLDIAAKYPNVKIFHEPNFCGFGKMKNIALSKATNDRILSIDSDEVLMPEIVSQIDAMQLNDNTVVALSRLNYYGNRCMKCCGWYPDYVWRIFNRKYTRFNENIVHEGVETKPDTQKVYIKDAIKHYAADSMESIIQKMNRYTTLSAQEKHKKGKKASVIGAIFRFIHTFNMNYFFRRGIFYGYKGFVVSLLNASGSFYRHMKLYELNKNDR